MGRARRSGGRLRRCRRACDRDAVLALDDDWSVCLELALEHVSHRALADAAQQRERDDIGVREGWHRFKQSSA